MISGRTLRFAYQPIRPCLLGLALVLLALCVTTAAHACQPSQPPKGSAERKAIMDSLRGPVETELQQKVVFVVERLSVCGEWAFLEALPKQPNGEPIDWMPTPYREAEADGMCGGYVHALLFKTGGNWLVLARVICASDVPWVSWPQEYGAPRELFPQ